MRIEDYDTGERYQARVIANTRITPPGSGEDVRELELEVEHPQFSYRVGQSIGVIISGPFQQDSLNREDSPQLALRHPHHFRLYTVADTPAAGARDLPRIKLCVRRCTYVDEYSGESYPGIASNSLCDLAPGDSLTINGPFGLPWELPGDRGADLLMIGMGTGIAPFRALVKYIYEDLGGWEGRVWLFNLARSGSEFLYMNEKLDAFATFDEHDSFSAIKAASPRPRLNDDEGLQTLIQDQVYRIKSVIDSQAGTVYVAGQIRILTVLERVIRDSLNEDKDWAQMKAGLQEAGRWQELLY